MKTLLKRLSATAIAALILLVGSATSALAAGLLTPKDSSLAAPQIRSHHVEVTIEDGYAITEVDQVFSNPNPTDLEAVYAFPVPEKGAVSEFTIWIDGQPVTGEVFERKEARKLYEEEKAAGREAGLTEKQQHYRFEVSVSPVRAQSETRIRLVYMQPAEIDTGIGRYVYPLEDGETDEQALAFWNNDPVVQEDFSFRLKLRSGYPVTALRLPQHPQAVIASQGEQEWQAEIVESGAGVVSDDSDPGVAPGQQQQPMRLDRDIVVYWRLKEGLPGSVDLVTYREPGKQRGTFMLTLTPGDDLAEITEGRDWVFVLDMSGSMRGKYQTLVDGVQRALGKLGTNDRFRFIRFNNSASELTPGWINATPEAIARWSDRLAASSVDGGTNLFAGLNRGLDSLDADRTSAIVLVTDGEANVGVTEKRDFIDLMQQHDVRLFTAVMGNGSNRPLLEAMVRVSNGFAVSVSNSDDIAGKLMEFTSKVSHEALHDLDLKIRGIRVADLAPAAPASLYRGEQLVVFGHYFGDGTADLSLTGKVSGQEKRYETSFLFPAVATENPGIERLWAYAKIRELQDRIDYLGADADSRDAIIGLAVEHGLVTDHTSMVVMREEQLEARGIDRSNRDRRQLEQGAASRRASVPVQNRRVDGHAPISSTPRASHGGGAMGIEILFLAAILLLVQARRGRLH
ncbi:MAG: VIT and VWA domain-containing protein [Chromatiales bacterium]|jgi:Ca-activated chloride channel family protein